MARGSSNIIPTTFPETYPIPREETNHPTVSTEILHLFASSKTMGPSPPITNLKSVSQSKSEKMEEKIV